MIETQNFLYDEFIENFVKAILGIDLKEIQEQRRQKIIEECIEIFQEFTYEYLKENEGLDYAMYFKAAQNSEGLFDTIPEFGEYFEDAYDAFLEQIELSWVD